jgi:uncharacterized protein YprB with RNaseH-like and TPR domain
MLDAPVKIGMGVDNTLRATAEKGPQPGKDDPGRISVEDVRLFLAKTQWTASGEVVFQSLARYLADSLEMDCVCLELLEENPLTARKIVTCFDGKFGDSPFIIIEELDLSSRAEEMESLLASRTKTWKHTFSRLR